MLTLTDLRYLRRLARCDYYETPRNYQQSERVEAKLTAMIAEKKNGLTANVPPVTTSHQGATISPLIITIPKGGIRVGRRTSAREEAPKKSSKAVGKKVKKK